MSKNNNALPVLTIEQLRWATENLNMRPNAFRRLKAVLVDGRSVAEVAQEENQSAQATYLLMKQVSKEFFRRIAEEDKVVVTVIAKPEDVGTIRGLESL